MKSLAWIGYLTEVEIVDFWKAVKTRKSIRPCWEWQGTLGRSGYGVHRLRSKSVPAHRLAYFIAYEVDPGELSILHACDNPKCVNARHLRPGTPAENARDRVASRLMRYGRWLASNPRREGRDWMSASVVQERNGACSDANPNALLTNAQATALRAEFWAGAASIDVAASYGIAHQVAMNIIGRHAYVDLPLADGEPPTLGLHRRAISGRRLAESRRGFGQIAGAAA